MGEIVWEFVECDIRNKTYEQLPEELKDRFDGYQIEVAIHQNCDISEISKLVRKYNNHKAMNQAQRAFTYVDAFAKEIRDITKEVRALFNCKNAHIIVASFKAFTELGRKARILKGKINQAISLRSFEHLAYFCECLSVLDHFATGDEDNLFQSVKGIFKRPKPIKPKKSKQKYQDMIPV